MASTISVNIIREGHTESMLDRRFYFYTGAIPAQNDIIDIDNIQYLVIRIIWKTVYTEIRPDTFIVRKVSVNGIPCD